MAEAGFYRQCLIIHTVNGYHTVIHGIKTLPRLVGAALSERLRVMPAVVVTGARQTGKSTFTLGASLLRVRRGLDRLRTFRTQSASIALKQQFLSADLTVKMTR
jgi:predicted AAA+ superfamily ATPase